MPEHQANPFNMRRGMRVMPGRVPGLNEVVECPSSHKTFGQFATIELMDENTQGEIDYYCPCCDTLVYREFVSPDRHCYEVVDTDHRLEAK